LGVIQADNQTLVFYIGTFPQGSSVGICECVLSLQQKKTPSEWTLRSSDASAQWTLRVDA
jgi:hypothetical protein